MATRRTATERPLELPAAVRPTHEDIAALAFQLYERRGGTDGGDLDDWLEAERQLTDARTANLAVA